MISQLDPQVKMNRYVYKYLVGGSNMAFILFHICIWDVILPIDELIFFKMVKTTNQIDDCPIRKHVLLISRAELIL